MASRVERRQALRFPITLPVELERGTGITRDISTSGVFFETDQVFRAGALDPVHLGTGTDRSRHSDLSPLPGKDRADRAARRKKWGSALPLRPIGSSRLAV